MAQWPFKLALRSAPCEGGGHCSHCWYPIAPGETAWRDRDSGRWYYAECGQAMLTLGVAVLQIGPVAANKADSEGEA